MSSAKRAIEAQIAEDDDPHDDLRRRLRWLSDEQLHARLEVQVQAVKMSQPGEMQRHLWLLSQLEAIEAEIRRRT